LDDQLATLDVPEHRDSIDEAVERIRRAYQARDVRFLSRLFFGQELRHSPHNAAATKERHKQEDIVEAIVFPKQRNCIVNACTQYGKTIGSANGFAQAILLQRHPTRNLNLAPQQTQTFRFRDYFAHLVAISPFLQEQLPRGSGHGYDRLRREFSKRRITFRDGSELLNMTLAGEAERAMGESADRTAHDEAALTSINAFARINRMHAQSSNPFRLEMSNPWHKENQYGAHWDAAEDPESGWRRIHIPWQTAVAEGRMTESFIETERLELPTLFFQVQYDSVFPDAGENQLIPFTHIVRAEIKRDQVTEILAAYGWGMQDTTTSWGLDVAEGGQDKSVLTRRIITPDVDIITDWTAWQYADTIKTANRVHTIVPEEDPLVIDANGVGKGVADRLQELGHNVVQLKAQQRAINHKRFSNAGSESLWQLREDLELNHLLFVEPPPPVRRDLTRYRRIMRGGRIAVEVEGGKDSGRSPDHGDSTAFSGYKSRFSLATIGGASQPAAPPDATISTKEDRVRARQARRRKP
jgi:hypothetical protein